MLPRTARMRSSKDFREAVRRGQRAGRPTLVVHAQHSVAADTSTTDDVQVGLVVSKAVGNAVSRNRVKRRLRHLALELLPETPPGSRIVVRALPRAASHPAELRADLVKAWARAVRRTQAEPAAGRQEPR